MTMQDKQTYHCMHCNNAQNFTVYPSVNVSLNPELRQKVLDHDLTVFTCAACGEMTNVEYSFVYHDMDNKYWFWCTFQDDANPPPDLDEACATIGPEAKGIYQDYHCRVVRNRFELADKVGLFEDGLDDRVMEIIKVYCLVAREELIGEHAKLLHYVGRLGEKLQFLSIGNTDSELITLGPDSYRNLYDKFLHQLPAMETMLGRYAEVNQDYALNVLEQLAEEKNGKHPHGIFSRMVSWLRA